MGGMVFYILFCLLVLLIWLETIWHDGRKLSIADLLKVTLLLSAMLAMGRMLALA